MAINKGSIDAMFYLACHYENTYFKNTNQQYSLITKYYNMAIEKGNHVESMYRLALLYYEIYEDSSKLLYRYMNPNLVKSPRAYQQFIDKHGTVKDILKLAIKYFFMASKHKHHIAPTIYIRCYKEYDWLEIDNDFIEFIHFEHVQDKLPSLFKAYKMLYDQRIDLMDLHCTVH